MEQDTLKSGGRLGKLKGMMEGIRPKNKPTTPEALLKRGLERKLGKSPLNGEPMVVGDLYAFPRKGNQALPSEVPPSGEVPAEALVVARALEGGSTLDTLAADTEMSPSQVNVGLAYIKGTGRDLSTYN